MNSKNLKNILIIGAIVLVILILVSAILSAVGRSRRTQVVVADPKPTATATPIPSTTQITVANISKNPSLFLGREVVLEASIVTWVDTSSFAIGGNTVKNGMLVVSKKAYALPIDTTPSGLYIGKSADVRIKGTVKRLNVSELEDDFDRNLNDVALYPWRDTVVIVASSVEEIN